MVKPSFFTLRLTDLFLAIILYGALLTAGCIHASKATAPDGTEIVVFVDFSESIRRDGRALFQEDLANQIIPSLTSGDRILIAPITDKTLTEFRALIEASIPPKPEFKRWLNNPLIYKKQVNEFNTQVAQIKEGIKAQMVDIFSNHNSSGQTDIFSSLILAQKLFHNEQQHKVLVLMSDMIEDYPPYLFENIPWNADTTQKLLMELDAKGLIPDLSGVCVYVSGASARTPDLARSIGSFWHAYFERARANMDPSRYAHVLLHWPPSKSCSPG